MSRKKPRTVAKPHYRDDGSVHFQLNGIYHRLDGPAIIQADGSQFWYKDGLKHRDGGPAVTHADGINIWYNNGLMHRDDGPSVESYNIKVKHEFNAVRRIDRWTSNKLGSYRNRLWIINGINLTIEIEKWLNETNITYPFSELDLMTFRLTWL